MKCTCGAIWLTNISFKRTLDQVGDRAWGEGDMGRTGVGGRQGSKGMVSWRWQYFNW